MEKEITREVSLYEMVTHFFGNPKRLSHEMKMVIASLPITPNFISFYEKNDNN